MMKIADVRAAVLGRLYDLYESKGPEWGMHLAEVEAGLDVHPGTVRSVLEDFRDRGVVDFTPTLDGPYGCHLTAQGAEDFEDPQSDIASYVQLIQHVTIHGGTNQVGNSNVQNITYQTVLNSLAAAIAADNAIAPDKKREWSQTLQEIAAHPLTQTVLGAVAGFTAGSR